MTDPVADPSDNPGKPVRQAQDRPPMSKMSSSDEPLGSQTLFDNSAFSPPTRPGILAVLDGFEVLRELGSGGMGVVLLARNTAMDTLVAIKLLRPDLAREPRAVHRFLTEARHMYRMSHPHILK